MVRTFFFRIFQIVFYNAARLLKWRKPVLLTGAGCVRGLPEIVEKFGIKRALFVADKGVMSLGLADALIEELKARDIETAIFADVTANPTIELIENAVKLYNEKKCGGFVAFGGGSAIDTAKAAAARIARPKKPIRKMGGFLKVRKKTPPVFAVPTTAGTGSEVTVAAVVTDGTTRHKYAVNDPLLIPVCAVLDPELVAGLPPEITAHTGMDALTHAVEAYITFGASKLCRKLSEDAVRLIFENLERSYRNGGDLEARQNMLLASFKAGDSFTRAGLTYVHPIAHTLGGLYNEAHGRANAVILPYVLEAFGKKIHRKLARLAQAAGMDVSGKSESEAAALFIGEIKRLNRNMGIPEKFGFIRDEDIPKMVEWALAEANPWYPVPVIFGAGQIRAIIESVREREEIKMDKSALIQLQRDFFNSGKTLDINFRLEALKKLAGAVKANENRILQALHADLGKSYAEGYMTEVGLSLSEINFIIKRLPRWAKAKRVHTPLVHFAAGSFIYPEPYGTVLIISPWNYPALLSLEPLAGAIAAGNCALLKPSKNSPETSKVLADIINGIFPPEFVRVIQGDREENADLLENRFDFIFFTGGTATGRTVMQAAAKNLTPVCLELGGKSPAVIDQTANIKLAAKRLAFGKFINAGQTCIAPDYVLIHQCRKEEFISELKKAVNKFYPKGLSDENLPRIVNERQFQRILSLMEGEKAAFGGGYDAKSLKIEPTVLDEVAFDSPVMGQEIFGPVLPVIAYGDADAAIGMIKSRPKPLALYVFSNDKAFQRKILREVSYGGGCINDAIMHIATPYLGFGGVGESGMGAYHGKKSFDTFTHYKGIIDKKNWIDLPLRYLPSGGFKEKIIRMFLR